jgi:hypothetical protein
MKTVTWDTKRPVEKVWSTFRFGKQLAIGENVVSVAISVALIQGVDVAPAAVIDGVALLLSGGRVMQRLQGGVDGASYRIRCDATTSNGQVLSLAGVLPVEEIA